MNPCELVVQGFWFGLGLILAATTVVVTITVILCVGGVIVAMLRDDIPETRVLLRKMRER